MHGDARTVGLENLARVPTLKLLENSTQSSENQTAYASSIQAPGFLEQGGVAPANFGDLHARAHLQTGQERHAVGQGPHQAMGSGL